MLGRQPVVDGHHYRRGAYGMLATGAVMGVEVTDYKAAAVEIHHHWWRIVIGWRPVDPDVDRARRPVDGAVLHPQLRMEDTPRQIPQLLAGRFDPAVDG